MEVSNQLVSWVITYLGDLQPTDIGVITQLLSTMDIPVQFQLVFQALFGDLNPDPKELFTYWTWWFQPKWAMKKHEKRPAGAFYEIRLFENGILVIITA